VGSSNSILENGRKERTNEKSLYGKIIKASKKKPEHKGRPLVPKISNKIL
jgi:hypothetical protein